MIRPLCLLALVLGAAAVERPFLLWTKPQAAELKQRIASDPQAKQQYERMLARDAKQNPVLLNLFKYVVMGDQAAGKTELGELLKFRRQQPETEVGGKWIIGNASSTDRHMRDERTLDAWRYDALYDLLTPEQRADIEESMRVAIDFHLSGHRPWHPDFRYDRTSWLPNMHYPRTIGTHVLAAALADPALIEQVFRAHGGLKWWFDEYLGDGVFYMEEFQKFSSNIGSMIQYANACDRLGVPQFGWGYQGRNGGNLHDFVGMMLRVSLPAVRTPQGSLFEAVGMGDAGILRIIDPGGNDGYFHSPRMWGPVPKMGAPLWFEALHAKFPDAGYDFFLARFAPAGATHHLPTLYFGCKPVEVARFGSGAKGPAAPSYASHGRGFALLRMAQDGTYWESPRPTVALQFGMYYVHYVHDCMSLLDYVAFNQRVYQRMGGAGPGYAGGEPWKDSPRGQAGGITVDNGQPQPVDMGNAGCRNQRLRSSFTAADHRFTACRAPGLFPDVDQERALILTDQYLLDATWLASPRPRTYDWQVNAFGAHQRAGAWAATDDLAGGKLFDPKRYKSIRSEFMAANDLADCQKLTLPTTVWSHRIERDQLHNRIHVLPEADTTAYSGKPATVASGATLLLRRQAAATAFVVVHEPHLPGTAPLTAVNRLAQSADGALVRLKGAGVDDVALIAWGDAAERPLTLAGEGTTLTATGYAFVRISDGTAHASGDIAALTLPGATKLVLNGKAAPATVNNGALSWKR